MKDDTVVSIHSQSAIEGPSTILLRERAGELLQAAVNAEVEQFLAQYADWRDSRGHAAVMTQ